MTDRLSISELEARLRDPDVPEEELQKYVKAVPNPGRPFSPHTSPLQSGSISHAIESAALVGVVDELVHGYGLSCGHVFETSRDEAADAFGFAAVVAEGVLVEVGL